ncbi:MAG: glycogen debranching enzyme family protein [Deltaproteobacteria bacterium]|nr:glycogen debranching enzyme family protein [Deltaproteobacteria bacterium]
MSSRYPDDAEWLEPDGCGGFASGTVCGVRTRRYHALLLTATTPPTGRMVLVNGFDAWVSVGARREALSAQRYTPDVVHPDGARRLVAFAPDPWPCWTYRLDDGTVVEQELVVRHGTPLVLVAWRLVARGPVLEPGHASSATARSGSVTLSVRPFLSGRDYHALHRENPRFDFTAEVAGERVRWRPYAGVPAVVATSNGRYVDERDWYRSFLYAEERARGLDCVEDLAAPGVFHFDLDREEAVLLLAAAGDEAREATSPALARARELRAVERRRRAAFTRRLERSADAYLVARGAGRTIVAGYPWFTDWGRDAFVALRGLCLATGRLDDARGILLAWADAVSRGMLPNRFPDRGDAPEYNAVDAALWYVVAAHEYVAARAGAGEPVPADERERLRAAIDAILAGYADGTRFGIRADADGLLAAGEPGVQLTWMDAKIGDRVVTPRIGKPVEVQALWLNALHVGSRHSERWREPFARGRASFRARFWNEEAGGLFDVVDCDHRPGAVDPAFRPNQIFAVGGLPVALLEGERARRLVDAVAARLWTPLGLCSLAPGEPGYVGRYAGGVRERDGAYHQGTVWPWLLGAFVEAWVRVRGATPEVKRTARERFLAPLRRHLDEAGLGHVSEIADGDPPHTPRGCPFQAWSVGEALRLDRVVLA